MMKDGPPGIKYFLASANRPSSGTNWGVDSVDENRRFHH
jgi:hypothetical protein